MRCGDMLAAPLLAGLVGFGATLAMAQSPPLPPGGGSEAAEVASCLCLQRDMERLGGDMAGGQRTLDQLRADLARIDAALQRERSSIDVNDPQAIALFRQHLAQRDALFKRSTGAAAADLSAITTRYNGAASQYNTQCANRPRDPAMLAQVQANLSCPVP